MTCHTKKAQGGQTARVYCLIDLQKGNGAAAYTAPLGLAGVDD